MNYMKPKKLLARLKFSIQFHKIVEMVEYNFDIFHFINIDGLIGINLRFIHCIKLPVLNNTQ
jgi:hypothetical protein